MARVCGSAGVRSLTLTLAGSSHRPTFLSPGQPRAASMSSEAPGLCRREDRKLLIVEKEGRKEGRKLARKTARRSVPTGGQSPRPRREPGRGGWGWPGKSASPWRPSLTLCTASARRCAVYIGSGKSQQDQNLAWKSRGALQNQPQLAQEQLPQTGRRGRKLHSAAFFCFFPPRVVHLARREQQPPASYEVFIERIEAEGWRDTLWLSELQ